MRIHFGNYEHDHIGPLSAAKAGKRRHELKKMFAYVKETYPLAREVRGVSWLYNREAYRRLFPPEYFDSREIQETSPHFQGSSRWGQFLDHRGGVRPALRERFRRNLEHMDIDKLWEVFPLPTFRLRAPIKLFYDYYLALPRRHRLRQAGKHSGAGSLGRCPGR